MVFCLLSFLHSIGVLEGEKKGLMDGRNGDMEKCTYVRGSIYHNTHGEVKKIEWRRGFTM